jgi:ring-1,2-phenylacetyl-CoA epoxidase subunit PaaD
VAARHDGTAAAASRGATASASRDSIEERAIWDVLESVPDPEIPVLTVVDLGIVRDVVCETGAAPRVAITPTYSGCPATAVIRGDIERALHEAGYARVQVDEVLSPPWTSDWLTDDGRRKLREFGIAPPAESVSQPRRLFGPLVVLCPRCGSGHTERVSEFGSTPCKAHYRCIDCREPFDYFKCI